MVLGLVAEGAIGLDDPVADRLPEFGPDPRITVRMLLQHTSGVFNFTGEYSNDGTFAPGIPAMTAGRGANRFRTYPSVRLFLPGSPGRSPRRSVTSTLRVVTRLPGRCAAAGV